MVLMIEVSAKEYMHEIFFKRSCFSLNSSYYSIKNSIIAPKIKLIKHNGTECLPIGSEVSHTIRHNSVN